MGALQRDASPLKIASFIAVGAALAVGLLVSDARADEDPWFGPDKAKHFGASATIAAGGYSVGVLAFDDRTSALALGAGLAVSAGVGKEVYDAAGHGHASERDLVWDFAGTVTGLATAWLVDRLIRGEDPSSTSAPDGSHSADLLTLRF